ncbi:hypothetical protein MPSEU_000117500 [Mayamaea pseudoterrestris]|nr:hypothetical protein MPSEU_000117500 [Mayamaea pseudoterrestris]
MRLYTLLLLACIASTCKAQRFDCDPCIIREKVKLQAIVHGTSVSTFWQQMQASMVQAAKDMRVDLNVQLYDKFDTSVMSSDILEAASADPAPDGLIVTIPDSTVQEQVGSVTRDTEIPVFGLNSGGDVARLLQVDSFIGMDEYLAGSVAGQYFLSQGAGTNAQGLFVNSELNNIALQERYLGLSENVGDLTFNTVIVDGTSEDDMTTNMQQAMSGCPYTHILLSTSQPVASAIQAIKDNGCSFDDIVIGTFDVSEEIYKAISDGQLDFTISQQTHLQGSLPVVLATLFSTTGRTLAESSESRNGIYLSGPMLLNATNLPTSEQQVCQFEAFPICPNEQNPTGGQAQCACIDRSQIKLRGITHGVTTDAFWDQVYAGFDAAAADFGVDMVAVRPEPSNSSDGVYLYMVTQIEDFCDADIDGLFVSIPTDIVAEALSACLTKGIPVVSINAGSTQAKELGLMNHVGQIEYSAGKKAGEQMIEMGVTTGICLRHEVNNTALLDRCNGMEEAFKESTQSVTYLGGIDVPADDVAEYITLVEELVGDSGDWAGYGMLLGGAIQVPSGLEVQKAHASVVMGTFDTDEVIFGALDEGKLLFGIDQNAYLQGYLPIPLLAWKAYAQQALATPYVETGPRVVLESPSTVEVQCQASDYETCAPKNYTDDDTTTTDEQTAESGSSLSMMSGLSLASMMIASIIVYT